MTDDSTLIFRGPGPFRLPIAQSAKAHGDRDNGVTIIFRVVPLEPDAQLESVSVQMLSKVARKLAAELIRAADKADGYRS